MEENDDAREVPYHEHRIIVQLLGAHIDAYQDRLKALVAFGDVVARGASYNVDLLKSTPGTV